MPLDLSRDRTSCPMVKILATDRRKLPEWMCPSVPACRWVAAPAAGVVVDESVEVPMTAHQSDMHREEDTTTGAGPASIAGRSSRIAAQRRRVPYAGSYPAEGRHRAGRGRCLCPDGGIRASIRWDCPQRNHFSSVDIGRDDAESGPSACRDLARVGSIALGAPRVNRIWATNLGMCLAATVVPEAFSPGPHRWSCSVAPFRR